MKTLFHFPRYSIIHLGHIPANNGYGHGGIDVAIRVLHPRREDQKENLHMQFKVC